MKIKNLILIFIVSFFFISEVNIIIFSKNSKISLVIYKNGTQDFLHQSFYVDPSDVIINGISKIDNCKKKCELEDDYNNITLIFEDPIISCSNMFKNLINITEINLENFDMSEVTNMFSMFSGCSNLEKINFGNNLDTSSVSNMNYLFQDCKNLKSIDLSNFDTSNVVYIDNIFSGCKSIKSIDLSNFNTSKIEGTYYLFSNCFELISIDLSSFETSHFSSFQAMFSGCIKLKYLDLPNFKASSANNLLWVFNAMNSLEYLNLCQFNFDDYALDTQFIIPSSVKYYAKNSKVQNILLGIEFSNCDDFCVNNSLKLDISSNKCVEKCDDNKFEYKRICGDLCFQGFSVIINKKYLCLEELPENYYLDANDGIYKECFYKCKKCNESGEENNNNCDECLDNLTLIN